ncbi:hypothetical protein ACEPAI_6888 [Sanghuangporus weigelae]
MPGLTLPPFPDNLPTHPLLVIDYELLKNGDSEEIEKLWKAATELGFWYLKNHGADREVEGMFEMGEETMDLPLDEKLKYEYAEGIETSGYKALGTYATSEYGTPDNVEFINISREDTLAYPKVVHRTYPSTVVAHMEPTIIPFVHKSLAVIDTILSVFEKKLDLPAGTLLKLHAHTDRSGSEARAIKSPPKYRNNSGAVEKEKLSLGAHTDIGSLSFLHNRLGGLQVFPPNSADWQYVRPIPGHAICNIGDALSLFSGGILRSNMHRVVPPPGVQGTYPRWSVVFFCRPGHNIKLNALEESPVVRAALVRKSPEEKEKYKPNVTQGEWYNRRIIKQRASNVKKPEDWYASRGMEHTPNII